MSDNIDLSKDYIYNGTFGTLIYKHQDFTHIIIFKLKDKVVFPFSSFDWYRYIARMRLEDGTVGLVARIYDKEVAERIVTEVIRYDKLTVFK